MGSNTWRAEDWSDIVDAIRSGDPTAAPRIADRERAHDNFFQVLSRLDFVPVVTQLATVTFTTYHFSGLRVGPWVQLNFRCAATSVGTAANAFAITTPTQFPIDTTGIVPLVGTMWHYNNATGVQSSGVAQVTGSTTAVNAVADGSNNFMGIAAPAVAIAVGDQLGYMLQFLTSATL